MLLNVVIAIEKPPDINDSTADKAWKGTPPQGTVGALGTSQWSEYCRYHRHCGSLVQLASGSIFDMLLVSIPMPRTRRKQPKSPRPLEDVEKQRAGDSRTSIKLELRSSQTPVNHGYRSSILGMEDVHLYCHVKIRVFV